MNDGERKLLILGLVDSVITVIVIARLIFILTIGKMELIIQRHYSGYRDSVIAMGIATLIMIVTMAYVFLKYQKARQRKKKTTDRSGKTAKNRKPAVRLDTPEEIYDYLKNNSSDSLKIPYRRILAQLDEMNNLQERLEKLLEINNSTTSLNETRDLLQDIENVICLEVRKIINFQIAGGEDALLGRIEGTLVNNRRLLEEAEGVLIDIAEFINGGEGDITHISQRIQEYRQTIQEFLKEENEDDNEENNRDNFSTDAYSVARGMRG